MQRKYSFLVLTDHRVHKPKNPIYSLIPQLRKHPKCQKVYIASRGNPRNDNFFIHKKTTEVQVLEVLEDFDFEEEGRQYLIDNQSFKIDHFDAILMRLARPIDTDFMHFLAQKAERTPIINHPLGIEKTSNKSFLLKFPEFCPPMKLCHSLSEILDFATNFPIVLKPLKEYGGKGILKIEGDVLYEGNHKHNIIEFLSRQNSYIESEGYLAMKYMEKVSEGDKRILLIGRQIMGASLRLPPAGSWICNVAQGGRSVSTTVDPEEIQIIEQLIPLLEKEGILIAGIDTLMGDQGKRVLSEINTLSVGGFLNIQEQTNSPIIEQTVHILMDYVDQKIRS